MRAISPICSLCAVILALGSVAMAETSKQRPSRETPANPQMKRLADALSGDWNTTEIMEKSKLFPNGAARHGVSHSELEAGGTTLVSRGHSNGSAGPLSYVIAVWWDNNAKVYRFFTCFNDPDDPCVVRGTAHWEGKTFVNDYEDTIKGKRRKFRDTFYDITPNSHRLVEAVDSGNGAMTPLIRTMSIRRKGQTD